MADKKYDFIERADQALREELAREQAAQEEQESGSKNSWFRELESGGYSTAARTQQGIASALEGLGDTDSANRWRTSAAYQDEAAKQTQARSALPQSLSEVEGPIDLAKLTGKTLLNSAPEMGMIAGGMIAGGALLPVGAAAALTGLSVGARTAAVAGSAVGGVAGGIVPRVGGYTQGQREISQEETGIPTQNLAEAVPWAAASTLLDVATGFEGMFIRNAAQSGVRVTAKDLMAKRVGGKFLGKFGTTVREFAKGAAEEAVSEGFDQYAGNMVKQLHSVEGYDALDAEGRSQIIEGMVLGALTGGGLVGGVQVLSKSDLAKFNDALDADRAEAEEVLADIKAQETERKEAQKVKDAAASIRAHQEVYQAYQDVLKDAEAMSAMASSVAPTLTAPVESAFEVSRFGQVVPEGVQYNEDGTLRTDPKKKKSKYVIADGLKRDLVDPFTKSMPADSVMNFSAKWDNEFLAGLTEAYTQIAPLDKRLRDIDRVIGRAEAEGTQTEEGPLDVVNPETRKMDGRQEKTYPKKYGVVVPAINASTPAGKKILERAKNLQARREATVKKARERFEQYAQLAKELEPLQAERISTEVNLGKLRAEYNQLRDRAVDGTKIMEADALVLRQAGESVNGVNPQKIAEEKLGRELTFDEIQTLHDFRSRYKSMKELEGKISAAKTKVEKLEAKRVKISYDLNFPKTRADKEAGMSPRELFPSKKAVKDLGGKKPPPPTKPTKDTEGAKTQLEKIVANVNKLEVAPREKGAELARIASKQILAGLKKRAEESQKRADTAPPKAKKAYQKKADADMASWEQEVEKYEMAQAQKRDAEKRANKKPAPKKAAPPAPKKKTPAQKNKEKRERKAAETEAQEAKAKADAEQAAIEEDRDGDIDEIMVARRGTLREDAESALDYVAEEKPEANVNRLDRVNAAIRFLNQMESVRNKIAAADQETTAPPAEPKTQEQLNEIQKELFALQDKIDAINKAAKAAEPTPVVDENQLNEAVSKGALNAEMGKIAKDKGAKSDIPAIRAEQALNDQLRDEKLDEQNGPGTAKALREAAAKAKKNEDGGNLSPLDAASKGAAKYTPEQVKFMGSKTIRFWKNAPQFEVVDSRQNYRESRPDLQDMIDYASDRVGRDTDGRVNAIGHYKKINGKPVVLIYSDNVSSEAQLNAAIYHEMLGHHGLEEFFQKETDATLKRIYNSDPMFRELAKAEMQKVGMVPDGPNVTPSDSAIIYGAKEVLARAAETGPTGPVYATLKHAMNRIKLAIAKFMGQHYPFAKDQKFTDLEIAAIVSGSRLAVIRGRGQSLFLDRDIESSLPDTRFEVEDTMNRGGFTKPNQYTRASEKMTAAERRARAEEVRERKRAATAASKNGKNPNRTSEFPLETEGRIPAAKMQSIIDGETKNWTNKPDIVVVDSRMNYHASNPALHAKLQEIIDDTGVISDTDTRIAAKGTMTNIDGRDTMLIYADRLNGEQDAIATIWHEGLGHYGLRSAFGEDLKAMLDQMLTTTGWFRKQAEITANELGIMPRTPGAYTNEELLLPAEEVLAEMGETNKDSKTPKGNPQTEGFLARLRGLITRYARRMGFMKTKPFSNQEIWSIIYRAREEVMSGKQKQGVIRGEDTLNRTVPTVDPLDIDITQYTDPNSMMEKAKEWLTTAKSRGEKLVLSAMPSSDLVYAAKTALASAQKLFDKMQESRAYQNAMTKIADNILREAEALPQAARKATAKHIANSTGRAAWGFKPDWLKPIVNNDGSITDVEVDARAKAEYDALPAEAQKIVREVFKFGFDTRGKIIEGITKEADVAKYRRIGGGEPYSQAEFDALPKKEKARREKTAKSIAKKLEKSLGSNRNPYAPMMRFGKYVVTGKSKLYKETAEKTRTLSGPELTEARNQLAELRRDAAHYFVSFVPTKGAGETLARNLAADPQFSELQFDTFEKRIEDESSGPAAWQVMQKLKAAYENGADIKMTGRTKAQLDATLDSLYLDMLSEASNRRAFKHREVIAGASEDMFRAFAEKSHSDARFAANLELGAEMNKIYKEMRNEAERPSAEFSRDEKQKLYNEVAHRHMLSMRPPLPSEKLAQSVMGYSSMYHLLMTPKYYIQNLTQPWMLSAPYMAAKHGFQTYGKLFDYSKRAAIAVKKHMFEPEGFLPQHLFEHTIIKDRNGNDVVKITNPEDVGRYNALVALQSAGKLDVGLTFELGKWQKGFEPRDPSTGDVLRDTLTNARDGRDKLHTLLTDATRNVEIVNRVSSAMAAYDLHQGSHEAKLKYATEVLDKTQYDYASDQLPSIVNFQGGFGKVAMQFRKYQIYTGATLIAMMHNSFVADKNLQTEKERADAKWLARRQIALVTTHAVGAGGIVAAPFAGFMMMMAEAIFGDDDEPANAELWMKRSMGDGPLARAFLHGVPYLGGVDVGKSIGLGDIAALNNYTKAEGIEDYPIYAGELLTGATGGMVSNLIRGGAAVMEGDIPRGLQELPGFAGDIAKTYNQATSGITKRNGDMLVSPEDIGTMTSILTALGFQTTTASMTGFARNLEFQARKTFDARTKELRDSYTAARKSGDVRRMEQTKLEWVKFQQVKKRWGEKAQPLGSLLKAPKEYRDREKTAQKTFNQMREVAGFQ